MESNLPTGAAIIKNGVKVKLAFLVSLLPLQQSGPQQAET